jgi:hypothetical protein
MVSWPASAHNGQNAPDLVGNRFGMLGQTETANSRAEIGIFAARHAFTRQWAYLIFAAVKCFLAGHNLK